MVDGIVVDLNILPRSVAEASRDRGTMGAWTGDVYKLTEVLRRHRPDLLLLPLDTEPTGVLVVLGADPADRTLSEAYDEIIQEAPAPGPPAGAGRGAEPEHRPRSRALPGPCTVAGRRGGPALGRQPRGRLGVGARAGGRGVPTSTRAPADAGRAARQTGRPHPVGRQPRASSRRRQRVEGGRADEEERHNRGCAGIAVTTVGAGCPPARPEGPSLPSQQPLGHPRSAGCVGQPWRQRQRWVR